MAVNLAGRARVALMTLLLCETGGSSAGARCVSWRQFVEFVDGH